MERLTKRYDDGEAFCNKFSVIEDVGVDETILKGELIDKLAAYEDAEEQGLLLQLPFKIGQKVYYIYESRIGESKSFMIGSMVYSYFCLDFPRNYYETREEAEQALAEMERKI